MPPSYTFECVCVCCCTYPTGDTKGEMLQLLLKDLLQQVIHQLLPGTDVILDPWEYIMLYVDESDVSVAIIMPLLDQ